MENHGSNQNTPQLPTTLTLNGAVYNVQDNPELAAFVNMTVAAAATREKNKLYTTINGLKEQIEALANVKVVEKKVESTAPVLDAEQLKGDIVKQVTDNLKGIVAESLNPLLTKAKMSEEMEIAAYRNKLLVENQGKCIPEYVVGDTKEKLDASLKQAVELFAKYNPGTSTTKTPAETTQSAADQNTTTTTTTPAQTNSQTTTQEEKVVTKTPEVIVPPKTPAAQPSNLNVEGMSHDEYAAKRKELLKSVETLVNN